MPPFEAALSKLSKAGVAIVDPCDLPSAEQLQEVRSSVFRTEFKAALNTFLRDHERPCGIDSLAALIRWNEAHPGGDPVWPVAAARRRSHRRPRRSAIPSRPRRDIVLSRTAGIDAAMAASSGRCVDRADGRCGEMHRQGRRASTRPFRWGSMAPACRSASHCSRRRGGTAICSRSARRSPQSSANATFRNSEYLAVTRLAARGHAPRFPTRSQPRCHRCARDVGQHILEIADAMRMADQPGMHIEHEMARRSWRRRSGIGRAHR